MNQIRSESLASLREEQRFQVRLILVVVTVVATVVLLAVFRGDPPSPFPRVKLADGSWLVVRAVTVGQKHSIDIPFPRGFPALQPNLSYQENHSTQSNRMVIWLTHVDNRGEMLDFDWFRSCELVDGGGFRLRPREYFKVQREAGSLSDSLTDQQGYFNARELGRPNRIVNVAVIRCDLPLVRPREGKMRLEIYDGGLHSVAQLEIPYPSLTNPSADNWQPDLLPSTKTDGNLDVTLTGVQFHRNRSGDGIKVEPQLIFIHEGQPSQTWWRKSKLFDPLGNTSEMGNCDFSPFEAAWKIHLTVGQNEDGRFRAEEVLRLPPIPLPGEGEFKLLPEQHSVNGIPISLVGLGGPGPVEFTVRNSKSLFKTGAYQPGNYVRGMSSTGVPGRFEYLFKAGHPFLITSSDFAGSEYQIQIVFRDQAGELLLQCGKSGTEGKYFWFFEPKSTSQSIEIEIICQQQRYVEFLISPPKTEDIQSP